MVITNTRCSLVNEVTMTSNSNVPSDKAPGDLDVENASRGVWLVKVPKYLSNEWEKSGPKTEIGRLKITK